MKKLALFSILLLSATQTAQAHWGSRLIRPLAMGAGMASVATGIIYYKDSEELKKLEEVSHEDANAIKKYLGSIIPGNKPLKICVHKPEYASMLNEHDAYAAAAQTYKENYIILSKEALNGIVSLKDNSQKSFFTRILENYNNGTDEEYLLHALRHEAIHLREDHALIAGEKFVALTTGLVIINSKLKVPLLALEMGILLGATILGIRNNERCADKGSFQFATDQELIKFYKKYARWARSDKHTFFNAIEKLFQGKMTFGHFTTEITHAGKREYYEMALEEMKKRGLK